MLSFAYVPQILSGLSGPVSLGKTPMEDLQAVSRSPWLMAWWPVTLLYPIKFFKTSVSCTVIGCKKQPAIKPCAKGFVKLPVK